MADNELEDEMPPRPPRLVRSRLVDMSNNDMPLWLRMENRGNLGSASTLSVNTDTDDTIIDEPVKITESELDTDDDLNFDEKSVYVNSRPSTPSNGGRRRSNRRRSNRRRSIRRRSNRRRSNRRRSNRRRSNRYRRN